MFLTHPSLLSLALVFSTGFVFSTGLSYFSSVSRPSIHLIHHWYLIAGACNGHPVLSTSRLVSCVLFCIILTFIFSCAFVSPYLVPFSDKKKRDIFILAESYSGAGMVCLYESITHASWGLWLLTGSDWVVLINKILNIDEMLLSELVTCLFLWPPFYSVLPCTFFLWVFWGESEVGLLANSVYMT